MCSSEKGIRNTVYTLFSLGILSIVVAVFINAYVYYAINDGFKDNILVPGPDAEQWKINNWASNTNRSVHPPEIVHFYLYNITNSIEFMTNGTKPVLELVGPYTYFVTRNKFNISYSDDLDLVYFENLQSYNYSVELSSSKVSENDLIFTLNSPVQSVYEFEKDYTMAAALPLFYSISDAYCSLSDVTSASTNQGCMFGNRTAKEWIFTQYESAISKSNFPFPSNAYRNEEFITMFSCSTPDECHTQNTIKQNYGFGGKCKINTMSSAFNNLPLCDQPGLSADVRHAMNTGLNDRSQLSRMTQIYGNTSFQYFAPSNLPWQNDFGWDQYQVHPDVSEDEVLGIWDDTVFRATPFEFDKTVTSYDVEVKRFFMASEVFSGNDPFSPTGLQGLADLNLMSMVRYGSPTPVLLSRAYMAGADPQLFLNYTCINCPDVSSMSHEHVDSWVDIEPITGKVVGGGKIGQINFQIGQDYFRTPKGSFKNTPNMVLPQLLFNATIYMDADQAKLVRDGVNQIKDGRKIQHLAMVVLLPIGCVAVALAFALGYYLHKRSLCDDNMTVNGHSPYSSFD